MSIRDKYEFTVAPIPADAPAVKWYCDDHLKHFGYPPDIQPSSVMWLAVSRGGLIWAVIGIKPLGEKSVEVPDFYLHRSRWGILAGYAGLETIRDLAKEMQIEVVTATPVWNTKQMKAQEKVFGVSGPTHYIYRWRPWEAQEAAS